MDFQAYQNILENMKIPSTYWKDKSLLYRYWFRSLLQKVNSVLIWDSLPAEWDINFLLFALFAIGFVGVFYTERFGLTFNIGNISGYDFFYQPTKFTVSNPLYRKTLKIHKECELIKLTPDFCGIYDIINFYATKLAELSKGIDMGIINAKIPMILTANNQAQSATLKKIYDKVQAGESLVVWDNNTNYDEIIPMKDIFTSWNQDFKQTYIVTELLNNLNSLLDDFYTEIGLPVTLDKKAQVITKEADFQSIQSQARLSCWINTLHESIKKVNNMFSTDISVHEKTIETEEIKIYGTVDNNRS